MMHGRGWTRWLWLALAGLGSAFGQEEELPQEFPGVFGYVYVDPWLVEQEIVIRPELLEEWTDLGLKEGEGMDQARRREILDQAGAFLAERCPLTVGGRLLEMELEDAKLVAPSIIEAIPVPDDLVVTPDEVAINVVLRAAVPEPPKSVTVTWDLFPEGMTEAPILFADHEGTRVYQVRPESPAVTVRGRFEKGAREAPAPPPPPPVVTVRLPWLSLLLAVVAVVVLLRMIARRACGKVALILLLLAGAGAAAWRSVVVEIPYARGASEPVGQDEERVILDRLLQGVYHAFQFVDEGEQYDVLAQVAGEEALTRIYLEARRTIEGREESGAGVRVTWVEVVKAETEGDPDGRGFAAECEWVVAGRVGHWGHSHERANKYEARFTVKVVDGAWKITDLALRTRERRADIGPGVK